MHDKPGQGFGDGLEDGRLGPGSGEVAGRYNGHRQAGRPAGVSAGDGLPDQLGDIDDQIGSGLGWIAGRADLAGAHADGVVQPAVGLAVGQVEQCPDDLTASWG